MADHPVPPAPESSEPLKFPELNQALLDWPGVEQLLRDIELCTQITKIIPKLVPQGYVPETSALTLSQARELLARRSVRGLRIRYRHEGADWWDTLMVIGDKYRLVRIRHEFPRS